MMSLSKFLKPLELRQRIGPFGMSKWRRRTLGVYTAKRQGLKACRDLPCRYSGIGFLLKGKRESVDVLQLIRVTLCAHTRMIIFWAIVSLVIVPLDTAFAENITGPSPTMADVMLYMTSHKDLPKYCQVKMTEVELSQKFRTRDVPAQFAKVRDKWVRIIGKNNWAHFHHYCFGIIKFNKALRMTGGSEKKERRKKGTLNWALAQFKYIENSTTDRSFPLWPQLFMYEYQIYSQLGEPANAQRALQRAAEHQKRRKSRR